MSYKKQVRSVSMPSTEELKTAGIRELSAEELFEVNGGRNVEGAISSYGSDPDIPDDPPSSGGTSETYTDYWASSYADYWKNAYSGEYGNSNSGSSDANSSSTGDSTDSSSGNSSDNSAESSSDSSDSWASSSESPSDSGYSDDSSSSSTGSSYSSNSGSSSPSYDDEESGSYSYSSSNETSNNNSSNSGNSSSSYPDKDDNDSYAENHSGSSSDNSLACGNNGKKQTSSNSDPIGPANKPNNEQTETSQQKPKIENNKSNVHPIFPKDIFNKPRKNLAPLRGIAPEYRPLWPTESRRITSEFGPRHKEGIAELIKAN